MRSGTTIRARSAWFQCPRSVAYPVQLSTRSYTATLVRAASFPQGDARDLLPQIDHWIALVAGQKKNLRVANRLRPVTDAYLPPCNGTIAITERPKGHIRELAEMISAFLAARFS
jgi:hypothetical protein